MTMPHTLRIVSAQLNLHVGNLQANLDKHLAAIASAKKDYQADLIVFPELSLTGYPPEDLLLRHAFIDDCEDALQSLAQQIGDIYCIVGHPQREGSQLFNACSVLHQGRILQTYSKFHLPNYGVFDEKRYFTKREETCVFNVKGVNVGLVICEDIWSNDGPLAKAVGAGAQIVLVPNASPYEMEKHEMRITLLEQRTKHFAVPIVYVNNVGGQDELVFDGGSMVMSADGNMSHFAGFFAEKLMPLSLNVSDKKISIAAEQHPLPVPPSLARVYQALVMGTRDYIEKNHFPGVIIGLSGGIDSALTAAIAVDALGKERVLGVYLPSRYSADISGKDAALLAERLGIEFTNFSIEKVHATFLATLSSSLSPHASDITDQNIQSRSRAVILMALSNSTGKLVLTTGNRSEVAVGYCTLYGDMCGGFAVLKNVPKMLVYALAKYRNQQHEVIPPETIARAPTAELAPNQTDQDTLPPYPILDSILECYLDRSMSLNEIVAQGFERETVLKVVGMIKRNEYKRKQYALGVQLQSTSFIKDWRYPVTNGFKG